MISQSSFLSEVNPLLTRAFKLFMSDSKTNFAKEHGWMAGVGDRTGRFAMVIDKDGKIIYAEVDKDFTQVTVSGAEAVLSKL